MSYSHKWVAFESGVDSLVRRLGDLIVLAGATGLTATADCMDGEKNAYCLKVGFNAGHARH